jgi:hypothetical protein
MRKRVLAQILNDNLLELHKDTRCQKYLKLFRQLIKGYYLVYSHLGQGLYMTFENLVTFCKDFGIFPTSVAKQDLLCLY